VVSISLSASGKLDKSGGTLTGPLILERDPLLDLEAATRQFVLAHAGGGGGVQIAADLGGTNSAPIVISTHLAAPLPLAQGGTNAADAPGARTQLGLGTAATANTSAFDAAGAAAAAQAAAISAAGANAASTYLPLAGGTLTGALALGNHKLTGVADGTAPTDGAALGQVPTVGAVGAGAGVALSSTDATTTNARTPTAHASTHATGGTDPLSPAAIGAAATSSLGGAAFLSVGATAGTVAAGDDSRITGAVASDWCDMLGVALLTARFTESGVTYQQTAGDLVLCLCTPPKTRSISTLGIWVTAAGAVGSGVNALLLYTEAGVLIDQTGDMTAAFSSAGMAEGAMGGSHTVTAGTGYYLGFLTHFSGTSPHFAATGTTGTANFPVVNGHYTALFKGSQLSVPPSFTPSSYTPNSGYFIMYGR